MPQGTSVTTQAKALGLGRWLSTTQGRATVMAILTYARCADLNQPAELILPDEILSRLERQSYTCACGADITKDFQLAYRRPLENGGAHVPRNIRFTCTACYIGHTKSDTPVETRDSGSDW